jgi:predicted alpha-1,2-mannosidase
LQKKSYFCHQFKDKNKNSLIMNKTTVLKSVCTGVATLLCVACTTVPAHLSDYVNPFIGASTNTTAARALHGLGKTFPGAATPFGMTQVSPNTITGGDNGPGYSYEHTSIEGFAFTQMSGIGWYGDLGNLLVMPTTGELHTAAGEPDNTAAGYRSLYDKSSEQARAGYYTAFLSDYQIKAEATASPHGGVLRFTFPENPQSRIQIDLARRVGGTSVCQYLQVIDPQTIRGWMQCTPDGGGWGNGNGHPDYTVYFYARFSRPLENYGFWTADIPDEWPRRLWDVTKPDYKQRVADAEIVRGVNEMEGKHIGFFTEFPTRADETVEFKAGISFVDMQGAEQNFKAELEHSSFDDIHANARKLWDEALGKITVKGGTDDEKTVFYTALYHTMIDPRLFSDVDGRFPGGDKQIHKTDRYHRRTIFSGWDVFRSQFPLQTIINPTLVNDEINSFIDLAEESGKNYYERWEFLNAYSGCMIGNPAISVIADAWTKGIRDYDVEKAYSIALNTSNVIGNGDLGYTPGNISCTLEYAYSDWCMATLAKALGKQDDEKYFADRAKAYRLIFDPDVDWFRPKKQDGTWVEWPAEGRIKDDYGCVESNPYQQGWFVPHDMDGMVELMGGREKTLADLTDFFEKAPADLLWNSYYNHANEPVHHIPFIFNRLDAPRLTQKWTRHICATAYGNKVEGLVGNEDVGQMSAWYILAASGIHPLCPGDERYEITSPVFDEITFRLESGKTFIIKAINNSPENVYIQRAELNGKPYEQTNLKYRDIVQGGELTLYMGN